MKKFLVLLVAIATLVGCGKDGVESTHEINRSQVTLKYDQSFDFSVSNVSNLDWSSSDEYVGVVSSNGAFTAKHIGETTVTARSGGQSFTAAVIVEPYIIGILEPLYGQQISKGDVKAFESRRLDLETTTSLAYTDLSISLLDDVLYLWQDRGTWNGTYATFQRSFTSQDAETFYGERYIYILNNDIGSFYKTKDNKTAIRIRYIQEYGVDAYYYVNNGDYQ